MVRRYAPLRTRIALTFIAAVPSRCSAIPRPASLRTQTCLHGCTNRLRCPDRLPYGAGKLRSCWHRELLYLKHLRHSQLDLDNFIHGLLGMGLLLRLEVRDRLGVLPFLSASRTGGFGIARECDIFFPAVGAACDWVGRMGFAPSGL